MNQTQLPSLRTQALHISLTGMLTLAIAMGIGRFAFTPLLPMMLHDQIIDLSGGGWLATANYIGYFCGALLCALWRGLPPITSIRAGLVATVLLTLGMGLTQHQPTWLLLRFFSGVASAVAFVYSSGWCLQRLTQLHFPAFGGIIYCGPGLGIVLTGLASSLMVDAHWHAGPAWLTFGALAAGFSLMIWHVYRDTPATRPDSRSLAEQRIPNAGSPQPATLQREVFWQVLAYGMAGFGYIITATFLPVIARQALPGSALPDLFWPLFGLCVALSALGATRIAAHLDQRLLLAACYLMQALGVLISAFWPHATGFALGSILLGLPFTAITLFAMREARRLRSDHPAALMGVMTAAYGIGQIAGPPLATWLVQRSGSFTLSLCIAGAVLVLSAMLYVWLTLSMRLPNAAQPGKH